MDKRPYLRADDRRRQLLDAAARVFEREGLLGITMVAVAEEAGASRRLVYDHFGDLASLYEAFFEDRTARSMASTEAILRGAGDDGVAAITGMFRHLLTIPSDDRRALRLLVADAGPPDLETVRRRLRARIARRWLPRVERQGMDRRAGGAVLWTLLGTFLTLADLVGRGELDADQATAVAVGMAAGATSALAPERRP